MKFTIICDNCGRESKIELEKHYERYTTINQVVLNGSIEMDSHEIYGISHVECKGCGNSISRTEHPRR